LAEDVASAVITALGTDSEGSPVYWHTTATVIDNYLQTSLFASTISEHVLNEAMAKAQLVSELPLAYARAKQRLAVPIYTNGDATQQYLASQIMSGFTLFWKRALFIKFQDNRKKVYMTVESLVKDVKLFYDLHLEAGGVPNEPGHNSNAGYQGTQGNNGGKQVPLGSNVPSTVSGQKRSYTQSGYTSYPESGKVLTRREFDLLPSHILKGGSTEHRGQHAQCACRLCFRMGHSFEYCATHNSFNPKNGRPVESLPNQRYNQRSTPQLAIHPAPPVKRLTQ
jgi:hypothetical protein